MSFNLKLFFESNRAMRLALTISCVVQRLRPLDMLLESEVAIRGSKALAKSNLVRGAVADSRGTST